MRITALTILGFLALVSCDSDTPTAPPLDSGYPTTFPLLSPDALQALKVDYARKNPHLCSSLDDYGFPSGLCGGVYQGIPEDPDADYFVKIAKDFIRRNSEFTGVLWNDELAVHYASHNPSVFRVGFENQTLKGLPVEQTFIALTMDSNGVLAVSGHHYPGAVLPAPAYSATNAQQSIIGLSISYYGDFVHIYTHTVSQEDFIEDPIRVVLPHVTERGIELRVAWRVPVTWGWWVYVDTMTLEQLEILPLFVS